MAQAKKQQVKTAARQVLNGQIMAPNSLEAEESVLGSVLIDSEALGHIAQLVKPSDFFIVKHQWIYAVMLHLAAQGSQVDYLTVCEELDRREQLAEVGGQEFLSHLIGAVPTSVHALGYAKIVHECSVRRRMLAYASEVAQQAYDESDAVISSIGKLRGEVMALLESAMAGQIVTVESADQILERDYPEPTWLVPGMMTAGLTFLAGHPKGGKSWLALQLSWAVASGGQVFGVPVLKGRVLYLALEDSPRRINSRMKKQQWSRGLPVDFVTMQSFDKEIGDLSNGGADRIAYMIEKRKYRLVVIDTFGRAIGMYMKSGDSSDYSATVKALSPIQEMAQTHDCAVVCIDHLRKGDGSDQINPLMDLIGSVGKTATVDTLWGLYRKRGQLGAQLNVIGRDLEDDKLLALDFDKEFGIWKSLGDAEEIEMTSRRQEIINALGSSCRASITELAELTGQDKGNAHRRVSELVAAGKVRRVQEGHNIFYESL